MNPLFSDPQGIQSHAQSLRGPHSPNTGAKPIPDFKHMGRIRERERERETAKGDRSPEAKAKVGRSQSGLGFYQGIKPSPVLPALEAPSPIKSSLVTPREWERDDLAQDTSRLRDSLLAMSTSGGAKKGKKGIRSFSMLAPIGRERERGRERDPSGSPTRTSGGSSLFPASILSHVQEREGGEAGKKERERTVARNNRSFCSILPAPAAALRLRVPKFFAKMERERERERERESKGLDREREVVDESDDSSGDECVSIPGSNTVSAALSAEIDLLADVSLSGGSSGSGPLGSLSLSQSVPNTPRGSQQYRINTRSPHHSLSTLFSHTDLCTREQFLRRTLPNTARGPPTTARGDTPTVDTVDTVGTVDLLGSMSSGESVDGEGVWGYCTVDRGETDVWRACRVLKRYNAESTVKVATTKGVYTLHSSCVVVTAREGGADTIPLEEVLKLDSVVECIATAIGQEEDRAEESKDRLFSLNRTVEMLSSTKSKRETERERESLTKSIAKGGRSSPATPLDTSILSLSLPSKGDSSDPQDDVSRAYDARVRDSMQRIASSAGLLPLEGVERVSRPSSTSSDGVDTSAEPACVSRVTSRVSLSELESVLSPDVVKEIKGSFLSVRSSSQSGIRHNPKILDPTYGPRILEYQSTLADVGKVFLAITPQSATMNPQALEDMFKVARFELSKDVRHLVIDPIESGLKEIDMDECLDVNARTETTFHAILEDVVREGIHKCFSVSLGENIDARVDAISLSMERRQMRQLVSGKSRPGKIQSLKVDRAAVRSQVLGEVKEKARRLLRMLDIMATSFLASHGEEYALPWCAMIDQMLASRFITPHCLNLDDVAPPIKKDDVCVQLLVAKPSAIYPHWRRGCSPYGHTYRATTP
ncbi:hypothetical protein KIPB_000123 [Kipferlia bialata]|uniref:Uncharacterized protein n=1 Tax=Kipferlia bialata TaxID=797122 RepID=A0A9K3CNJ9_9EUKA|nr:hypothetical protein KIPB_000123 [Kipferlia bialata]|eukprot:g123.t1